MARRERSVDPRRTFACIIIYYTVFYGYVSSFDNVRNGIT